MEKYIRPIEDQLKILIWENQPEKTFSIGLTNLLKNGQNKTKANLPTR